MVVTMPSRMAWLFCCLATLGLAVEEAISQVCEEDEISLIQTNSAVQKRSTAGLQHSVLAPKPSGKVGAIAAVSEATELKGREAQLVQQPGVVTTVTHESWFTRLSHDLAGFIFGLFLIYFSVPALWLNEERNAKYETLIAKGKEECREISADDYDDKNTSWLVHASGQAYAVEPVEDKQFNVRYESGVIRLDSVVEIYRYSEVEHSETKEEETFGGGKEKTTRTWQEYPAGWHSDYDSGASFKDPSYRGLNSKPAGILITSSSSTCGRVEFGKGFLLGEKEIDQFPSGTSATLESSPVCKGAGTLTFEKQADGFYYAGKGPSNPQIGDVRVSFTVLKDGPATVLALQAAGKEEGRGGFLPFRVIRRPACPCFPLTEEQEKERYLKEAKKSMGDFIEGSLWNGVWWCCCCPCNILNMCCSAVLLPELHHLWPSKMSKDASFENVKGRANMIKWGLRIVGWGIMFLGLDLLFQPFKRFLDLIPFGIGTFLKMCAGFVTSVFSLIVTVILASLIVAVAYSIYHPFVGIMAFSFLAAVIAGIVVLANVFDDEKKSL